MSDCNDRLNFSVYVGRIRDLPAACRGLLIAMLQLPLMFMSSAYCNVGQTLVVCLRFLEDKATFPLRSSRAPCWGRLFANEAVEGPPAAKDPESARGFETQGPATEQGEEGQGHGREL